MLEASLLMSEGKPGLAASRLEKAHDGNELYLSHALLMRALVQSGRLTEAVRESDWLASHRGRAYGEYNLDSVLTPANVVQSNLAILSGAELMLASKRPKRARNGSIDSMRCGPARRTSISCARACASWKPISVPAKRARSKRLAPAAAGAPDHPAQRSN